MTFQTKLPVVSPEIIKKSNERLVNLTLLICSAILASISATFVIYMFRRNAYFREKMKGFVKISEDWLPFDYQVCLFIYFGWYGINLNYF